MPDFRIACWILLLMPIRLSSYSLEGMSPTRIA